MTPRKNVHIGCGVALSLLALIAGAGAAASMRRAVGRTTFGVEIVGGDASGLRAGTVRAEYAPDERILFVDQGLGGTLRSYATSTTSAVYGRRLTFALPAAYASMREEWLSSVHAAVGGSDVTFEAMRAPTHFGPPELGLSGYQDPNAHAVLRGDTATLRVHALFLPPAIYFDRAARDVAVTIDVRPIPVTRLEGDGGAVQARPGMALRLAARVRTTGSGWPAARRDVGRVPHAVLEAVVVSRDVLLQFVGWGAARSPTVPVTRSMWTALQQRRDRAWTTTVDGDRVRVDVPRDATGDRHLVVVSFRDGENLAAAADATIAVGLQ